ncbi:MAG: cytochrome c biogenesis protein CcdA [Proteobacteria bacterium]|nr:cytochrome c biogenesis protein CcdA [Pseudomonadota bacterium]
MEFGLGTYGIAFAAGGLSTLSPCVLPLVPILIGSALTAHRFGAWALAGGLALSFTLVGALLASLGATSGLDPDALRTVAAVMLLVFGGLLVSQRLQDRFALATAGVSGAGQNMLSGLSADGLSGQFTLGLLLGIVWSPCVGPTLGAAITLASQGEHLSQVALVMALFGLGAGIPLIVLGTLSRQAMSRIRGRLLFAGRNGKKILGVAMLILAAFILTGADKSAESWILDVTPDWVTRVGTQL